MKPEFLSALKNLSASIGYSEIVATLALGLSVYNTVVARLDKRFHAKIFMSHQSANSGLPHFVLQVVNACQVTIYAGRFFITERKTGVVFESGCIPVPGEYRDWTYDGLPVPIHPGMSYRFLIHVDDKILSSAVPSEALRFDIALQLANNQTFKIKKRKLNPDCLKSLESFRNPGNR